MRANVKWLPALAACALGVPVHGSGQDPHEAAPAPRRPVSEYLPAPISGDAFAELRERSPFQRTLDLSGSFILTGMARIEQNTLATLFDLDTRESFVVSGETNSEGWQLVEITGDPTDLETVTARIRASGAGLVSIRYQKPPADARPIGRVRVSRRIGDGSRGGGTGPHGGPDPTVLTPDQLSDARNAARNIRDGFQADGYGNNEPVPEEVVRKLSRLSVPQREAVNVKMFEYRNRGLGMRERRGIYNGLLDRELGR